MSTNPSLNIFEQNKMVLCLYFCMPDNIDNNHIARELETTMQELII